MARLRCLVCFLTIVVHGLPSESEVSAVVEDVLTQSQVVLKAARRFRNNPRKHHSVSESPLEKKNALTKESSLKKGSASKKEAERLWAQVGMFINSYRGKTNFSKPLLNDRAREWVNMMREKAHTMHKTQIGSSSSKKSLMMSELGASPTLIVGFIVDVVDLMALIAVSFLGESNKYSFFIDIAVLLSWWAVGAMVLVVDMEMDGITALYALSQIPTTIGFGDYCPKTVGLKLFQALHVWVSTASVSGYMYWFVDEFLDIIESALNFKNTNFGRMIIVSIELIIEMVFSTVYYGIEFMGEDGELMPNLINAFYMTMVAISTVGYGDFSPSTEMGQGVHIPWQFIATQTMGRFAERWEKYRQPTYAASRRAGARRSRHANPMLTFIKDPATGEKKTIFTKQKVDELAENANPNTTTAYDPPVIMPTKAILSGINKARSAVTGTPETVTTAEEASEEPVTEEPDMSTNEMNEAHAMALVRAGKESQEVPLEVYHVKLVICNFRRWMSNWMADETIAQMKRTQEFRTLSPQSTERVVALKAANAILKARDIVTKSEKWKKMPKEEKDSIKDNLDEIKEWLDMPPEVRGPVSQCELV